MNWQFFLPHYWLVWLFLGILWVIAQWPYAWQMAIGRGLGRLLYALMPLRRHFAEVNIGFCFIDKEEVTKQQLLKQHFESFGMGIIETGMAWWAPNANLDKLVTIQGLEYLTTELERNHGVILLSAHFTSLELGGRLLNLYQTFDASYRLQKRNLLFNHIMTKYRNKHINQAIDSRNIRQMLRCLKSGHALWYAPDQDHGRKNSVFVPFCHVSAATVSATAKFVKLTQAKVIPFFTQRLSNNQGYRIILSPALENFPVDNEAENARRINKIIEAWIQLAPEQYLWNHRRFKTRPNPDDPKLYRPKPKKIRKIIKRWIASQAFFR